MNLNVFKMQAKNEGKVVLPFEGRRVVSFRGKLRDFVILTNRLFDENVLAYCDDINIRNSLTMNDLQFLGLKINVKLKEKKIVDTDDEDEDNVLQVLANQSIDIINKPTIESVKENVLTKIEEILSYSNLPNKRGKFSLFIQDYKIKNGVIKYKVLISPTVFYNDFNCAVLTENDFNTIITNVKDNLANLPEFDDVNVSVKRSFIYKED